LEPEAAPKSPKIFRITLEVADIDKAAKFYAKFLGIDGKRHPGARHYFDCGGVILAVLDPTDGGMTPTPGPKSLYCAVTNLDDVHGTERVPPFTSPRFIGRADVIILGRTSSYQRCQTQAVSLCTKKLDRGAEASEVARP